ncbi:MAG: hypothetical protein KDD12_26790, partial [Lewinella sp.]|nr:hypothetical protein [Lewinella sp.]
GADQVSRPELPVDEPIPIGVLFDLADVVVFDNPGLAPSQQEFVEFIAPYKIPLRFDGISFAVKMDMHPAPGP